MVAEHNDLTLEKLKIDARLSVVETIVNQINEKLEGMNTSIKDHIAEDRRLFYGNGGVGITTRLDRVEQREKSRQWTLRAIVVAVLGIIGKIVSDLFGI